MPSHIGQQSRTALEEVMEIVTNYYRELFQQEFSHPHASRCREQVWSHILTMVSHRMRESCMTPFTIQELLDAFMEQDGHKCPGEDGLSHSFFPSFWDQIHQSLLSAF